MDSEVLVEAKSNSEPSAASTPASLTEESFERVLAIATSVTFDIKAFDDEVHRTLTGASVDPVLRNAERIGREHRDRLSALMITYPSTHGVFEQEVRQSTRHRLFDHAFNFR